METKLNSKGKRFFAPAMAAGLMLAMAFTLNACGGDGGGGDDAPSSSSSGNGSPSSSSSGVGSPSSSSQPTHEHTWGEWAVTTAATCEAAGVKTRTCTGDNSHKGTEEIAKLSWEWTVTTLATPTTVGLETGTCPNNASPAQTRPLYPKCGEVEYNPAEKLCDERGEKKLYKYVKINGQTWMAENLNHDTDGSRCYDDNTGGDSESNCAEYGRLYDWPTAMDLDVSCYHSICNSKIQPKHQGVCPYGWHMPSDAEWDDLIAFIHADKGLASFTSGGSSYAGKYLKAATGWNNSGNGTDDYGFSVLPGGHGVYGYFYNIGSTGYWWSASEGSDNGAYYRGMTTDGEIVDYYNYTKDRLFSVRCLQN
ncbi:MAG: fibrobacter succinogenes major paralogous domain-containing protein [Fibromonadaceae bacterium]|jgi:uncharacterized protein (TIGR02145 family)|nr:fibrobacter succinogenes major paralogous domain-containing protein [Fibromonadaceae bacterium]